MSFTDSTTEQVIDGKAYVLKTTEGEEVVDPARLFGDGQDVSDLERRVERLERELGLTTQPVEDEGQEPEKEL